jgi:hypothetical protein
MRNNILLGPPLGRPGEDTSAAKASLGSKVVLSDSGGIAV